jgi:exosortase/archaeosortase family protein
MKMTVLARGQHPVSIRKLATISPGPVLVALGAAGAGGLALKLAPALEPQVFIAGAARLASVISGVPAEAGADGWWLVFSGQALLVTAACSATDFFLMTAALLGWHGALRAKRPALLPAAGVVALVAAVPLTLLINALRLIAVAHAHRWVIPRLPEAYGAFLHLLTGVAVFLPALIALNLIFEIYGRSRIPSRA